MRGSVTVLLLGALALVAGGHAADGFVAALPAVPGSAWWGALSFALAAVIDPEG